MGRFLALIVSMKDQQFKTHLQIIEGDLFASKIFPNTNKHFFKEIGTLDIL